MHRCPGQDPARWKPKDVFEVKCPGCGKHVEFWKDEPVRKCPHCGQETRNPRIDLGCAEWCRFADQCLGKEFEKSETGSGLDFAPRPRGGK